MSTQATSCSRANKCAGDKVARMSGWMDGVKRRTFTQEATVRVPRDTSNVHHALDLTQLFNPNQDVFLTLHHVFIIVTMTTEVQYACRGWS